MLTTTYSGGIWAGVGPEEIADTATFTVATTNPSRVQVVIPSLGATIALSRTELAALLSELDAALPSA